MSNQEYVYVLRAGSNYKIGRTYNVHKRVASLQTGSAYPIEVVCAELSDQPGAMEKNLHDLFSDRRLKGEWFALSEDELKQVVWIVQVDCGGKDEGFDPEGFEDD